MIQIVNYPVEYDRVGASGICPHCGVNSLLKPVATHKEYFPQDGSNVVVSAAQCEACKSFALVIGKQPSAKRPSLLVSVYPLGRPRDAVDLSVPKVIAEDFAEALRCEWIKAYKACVVMCRRAIQSSAIALGAAGDKLINQIDSLFSQGTITKSLKDFAHEIRLTGNDGAHPDKDGLGDVTEGDASAIIEFTREYLHHVYVMPAKLAARKPPVERP